mmetsp:Transcript_87027/g.219074  ORF Transcript_87027/g.219074 Transcript_87027/m.219074 type:complete len:382 (+) Transcript_87027:101-1246(+)
MASLQSSAGITSAQIPEDALADLVLRILKIPNPQEAEGGRPGEADLMVFICAWLRARGIPHQADPSWGVHAVFSAASPDSKKPGVLLAAHLDSDELIAEACSSLTLDREGYAIRHKGPVGQDCKLGVAMILAILENLRLGKKVADLTPTGWTVHVLFTIGEESGQKGAIRAPLPGLLHGRIRHAIVLDRMTQGACAPFGPKGQPMRHAVRMYKGVPLLDSFCGAELIGHLEGSMRLLQLLAEDARLPLIKSPNCSDALELRGRWDAEVVAPEILRDAPEDKVLAKAVQEYTAITATIRDRMDEINAEDRVSGMNSHPRYTRYQAMGKVNELLNNGRTLDPSFWFSCVNLSYDYDEDKGCVDLNEVEETVSIVLGFITLYFS